VRPERADEEALPSVDLLQGLLPFDRPARLVPMSRDHLGVEFASKRDDLSMRELRRRRADQSGTPLAFKLQVLFLATQHRFVPVARFQAELDLGGHAELAVRRRNAAAKPVELRARIFPRLDHAKAHGVPLLCTTGLFRKALFCR
jgi:hypothetical protein